MRSKMATAICAVALASASGSACGMTTSSARPERCRVIGGDMLPAETGGPGRLCAAIEAAVASNAPGVGYTVDVRVLSNSSLAASVRLADGKTLPEQKMAVSDRQLHGAAIERFAAAIGQAIGRASGR